ncbi:kynurenine aminotransferase [Penaeus vannamei]|uniref:kynurenine aminotransferase n=1 Tax=Penaeus vannamei TaxID=6689 RepID=UPI00387F6248
MGISLSLARNGNFDAVSQLAFKIISIKGHPRLIAALSKLYSKLIGRELNPLSEVLVTAGAYEALFVTIMGLVNQGDEVIIIEPFFDCYVPQVKLAGGTPVFVPLRPRKPSGTMSSADWILDPAELEAAFSEKTKAIVVNTPNNPLGKVKHKRQFSPQSSNNKNHGEIVNMFPRVRKRNLESPGQI